MNAWQKIFLIELQQFFFFLSISSVLNEPIIRDICLSMQRLKWEIKGKEQIKGAWKTRFETIYQRGKMRFYLHLRGGGSCFSFLNFGWMTVVKPRNWQAYYILDELLLAGELQESSRRTIARLVAAQVWFVTNCNAIFSQDSDLIYGLGMLIYCRIH